MSEAEKPVEPPRLRSQAERVIAKFGGARKLAAALKRVNKGRDPVNVYRWTYGRERRGTGGLIPTSALHAVLEAARLDGVLLTLEDIDPRPRP